MLQVPREKKNGFTEGDLQATCFLPCQLDNNCCHGGRQCRGDYSGEEGGSDWSVTKAENELGLDDDIDPDVELKREKMFCCRSLFFDDI